MNYCIHLIGEIERDPRPKRFLEFLKSKGKKVAIIEYEYGQNSRVIRLLNLLKFYLGLNREEIIDKILNVVEKKSNNEFEPGTIHVIEDLLIIPHFFSKYKTDNSIVIADLREYYPLASNDLKFKYTYKVLYNYIIDHFLKKVDNIITVTYSHRDILLKKHNLNSEVLLSLPKKSSSDYKEIDNGIIQFAYLGLANKYRGIELACDAFRDLSNSQELHLYLTGDKKYIEYLANKYSKFSNISFHEIDNHIDLETILLQNHVGLAIYNKPWNAFNALPNKFFKYINTHNMVIVLANSEMSKFVEKYKNGVIIKEFTSKCLTMSIQQLTVSDINMYRKASHIASYELCQEAQLDKYAQILLV
jgi:hypothetical protein